MDVSKELKKTMERLAECRKNKDLSYQDLEDMTGISRSTLQRYETGKIGKMPMHNLRLIADALGVKPSYLFGIDDEEVDDTPYDPDALEILDMLESNRDLKMLFMKTGKLSEADKKRIAKIIQASLPENYDD